MATDPERAFRDQQTTLWHDGAVAAGQRRTLSRAVTGELVSYLPEEYGVAKSGHGPTIRTVWGYALLVVGEIAGVSLFFYALSIGMSKGTREVPVGIWIMFAFFFVVIAYSGFLFIKELRAEILRRSRGLPRPAN